MIFYISLIAYCLLYYLFTGFAINIAYHRCLSHRAFKMSKPFERFFVALGLPAGTPMQWVGNHRFHHQNADLEDDPHSPVNDGFWHAHVGWYIGTKNPVVCFLYSIAGPLRTLYDGWNRPRTNLQFNHLAQDISEDRFYSLISRPAAYMAACWLHTAIFFGASFLIWGIPGFVAQWFMLVFVYNLGDAIDSFAHIYGKRPYQAGHFARNNKPLGFLTLGEGWHANHHTFPYSAKHGLLKGQFDAMWEIIKILEKLGIVSEINLPSQDQVKRRLI